MDDLSYALFSILVGVGVIFFYFCGIKKILFSVLKVIKHKVQGPDSVQGHMDSWVDA